MFLFGQIDMQIKLVPGRSAGTVVAYYVRKPFLILLYIYVVLQSIWTQRTHSYKNSVNVTCLHISDQLGLINAADI